MRSEKRLCLKAKQASKPSLEVTRSDKYELNINRPTCLSLVQLLVNATSGFSRLWPAILNDGTAWLLVAAKSSPGCFVCNEQPGVFELWGAVIRDFRVTDLGRRGIAGWIVPKNETCFALCEIQTPGSFACNTRTPRES